MKRVVDILNDSLHELMATRPDVIVIGEDIIDPYGGAFKVSKGLSSRFPDRVITTPISEAGIVGLGIGLALHGYRPIVEIMFGDFITLIADQLINHASKFTSMYGHKVALPLVVRTPMGGRRGYGPTHSQSIESLYMGVPGFTVAAISNVYDPGLILRTCVEDVEGPVLLVENKLLYSQPLMSKEELQKQGLTIEHNYADFPTSLIHHDDTPDVTIVTYGGMVPLVIQAADHLHSVEGLSCEIVVSHKIAPLDIDPIIGSVQKTRRVVVVEEGVTSWGWGSELVASLSHILLEAPPERVGAKSSPIPASRELENDVLPQVEDIIEAAIRTVDRVFV